MLQISQSKKEERIYSTYEKEALAILYCVHQFRPYVYGKKFSIITDHKPLVWMRTAKDLTSRLTRWRLKLEEYDFDVIYKAGKKNVNADALSRNSIDRDELVIEETQPVQVELRSGRIAQHTEKSKNPKIIEKPESHLSLQKILNPQLNPKPSISNVISTQKSANLHINPISNCSNSALIENTKSPQIPIEDPIPTRNTENIQSSKVNIQDSFTTYTIEPELLNEENEINEIADKNSTDDEASETEKDKLEKVIEGTKIIESRDPLYMRNSNLISI